LIDALVVSQIGQHLPLRPRQAEVSRVLLEASPQQSRDVMQQKSKCSAFDSTTVPFVSLLMISLVFYLSSAASSSSRVWEGLHFCGSGVIRFE